MRATLILGKKVARPAGGGASEFTGQKLNGCQPISLKAPSPF
jgi:hypothetical protein